MWGQLYFYLFKLRMETMNLPNGIKVWNSERISAEITWKYTSMTEEYFVVIHCLKMKNFKNLILSSSKTHSINFCFWTSDCHIRSWYQVHTPLQEQIPIINTMVQYSMLYKKQAEVSILCPGYRWCTCPHHSI